MPETIRQQIISAVDSKFKTILVTNGNFTNLGQNVKEWDLTPLDTNGAEAFRLTYRDEEEGREDETVGGQLLILGLTVWVLAVGSTSLATIRKMLADVDGAMYADPTWGGLAGDTNRDGSAKLAKAEAADTSGGFEVKYKIEYTVARGAS